MCLVDRTAVLRFAYFLPVIGLALVAGCTPTAPGADGDGGDAPAQQVAQYRFIDNTEGLVGGIDFGTGDHALIYGAANDDGTLSRLDAIAVIDAGGSLHEVHFDEDGMPIRIRSGGQTWDIAWQSDQDGTPQATLMRDGETVALELSPEALDLIDLLQSEAFAESAPDSARGFNRVTFLGAVSMGLGMAGFIGLAAATTPLAVAASVVGIVSGVASGADTIARSVADRPPTEHEQRMSTALSVLSAGSGAASLVSASASIGSGLAVPVAERLGVVGLAVDLTTAEQSELLAATSDAQSQGCSTDPTACEDEGGDDDGFTEVNQCCVSTDNCPTETGDACPGDCCCCNFGEVCVDSVCVGVFEGKPAPAPRLLRAASGPELKQALTPPPGD